MEATDSIQIIDKLSVLGSQYAVSSTDLGAALSESASTLASTGNSIDETLAMITAMSEVTHSASESGDALNSLAMQLRGYDEETGAYSKNIAELTTSIAQLTATASTPSGISIFTDDTESTYKSTYQIMKDISAVWDSMSNKNQVKLLDVLGGSQNGDNVSALLGNMSQAQNALQSSIYSTGSAYAKQEEWLQSLEGKVQQFQTAFQGLSQAVMDSDFLKGLVDTGTGLI
ncbi:phage tail tape measure protein, partial [Anaerosporobacter sp.]|uniref:phage tail tape measure protein n=1 Tax=Anaerosporobacter sp. TaxID=1872529 RepID=UPI00286F0A48